MYSVCVSFSLFAVIFLSFSLFLQMSLLSFSPTFLLPLYLSQCISLFALWCCVCLSVCVLTALVLSLSSNKDPTMASWLCRNSCAGFLESASCTVRTSSFSIWRKSLLLLLLLISDRVLLWQLFVACVCVFARVVCLLEVVYIVVCV